MSMIAKIQESVQDPPEVIKVGDRVMVTKPEFIVRVGYPLSFEMAKRWIIDNMSEQMNRLLELRSDCDQIAGDPEACCFVLESAWYHGREGGRILSALAKLYQYKTGFGGRERRLHTYREDDKLGIVCTGDYYPPSVEETYNYWDCEREYVPGGLTNSRSHVLLQLGISASLWGGDFNDPFHGYWIERYNLRKVDYIDE